MEGIDKLVLRVVTPVAGIAHSYYMQGVTIGYNCQKQILFFEKFLGQVYWITAFVKLIPGNYFKEKTPSTKIAMEISKRRSTKFNESLHMPKLLIKRDFEKNYFVK